MRRRPASAAEMLTARAILVGICLAVASGCGTASVTATRPFEGSSLPRPRTILVYDFQPAAATPAAEVDGGLAAAVAKALSDALVEAIEDLGIDAVRSTDDFDIPSDSMALYGELFVVDEGSRWRRALVGFGYGASRLATVARLYRSTPSSPELLAEYETTASSGRKPGIATTLPVGLAVQGASLVVLAVNAGSAAAGDLSASLAIDAKRTGKEWVDDLDALFESQGWYR